MAGVKAARRRFDGARPLFISSGPVRPVPMLGQPRQHQLKQALVLLSWIQLDTGARLGGLSVEFLPAGLI
jgi:hypothetical protein